MSQLPNSPPIAVPPANLSRSQVTETSLRQISESLSRIRDVRRSILQLSSEMQEGRRNTTTMDPGHDSITLTTTTNDQDPQTATDTNDTALMQLGSTPMQEVEFLDNLDWNSSLAAAASSSMIHQSAHSGENDPIMAGGGDDLDQSQERRRNMESSLTATPIPTIPGFWSAQEALRWVDNQLGGIQDTSTDTRSRDSMDVDSTTTVTDRPRFILARDLLNRLEHQFPQDQSPRNAPVPSQHPVDLPPLDTMVGPSASAPIPPTFSPSNVNSHIASSRRRTFAENFSAHSRREAVDDSATFLGRRVAAREANASSSQMFSGTSSLLADIEYRTAAQVRRLAELHADFVRFRSQMRNRRLDQTSSSASSSLSSTPSVATPPTRSAEVQTRSLDSPAGRSHMSSITRRLRYSRDRDRMDARQSGTSSTSSQSGRLSLLSNMSIQNLTNPSSASVFRPLLFDEPTSYEDAPGPTVLAHSEDVEGRDYYITRRLNADGDEYVHNISLSPSEEDNYDMWFASNRANNSNPRQSLRRSARDTLVPPIIQEDSPQPRGWVRLDRHGNEISPEAEEVLEAQRTEYRLQALQRHTQTVQGIMNDAESPIIVEGSRFAPFTGTSVPQDDPIPPRVRLSSNPGQPRAYYGSVLDSVLAINSPPPGQTRGSSSSQSYPSEKGVIGTTALFQPSILPMPLSDMVSTRPPPPPSAQPIMVHSRIIAGR